MVAVKPTNEFLSHVVDRLEPIGQIKFRAMFGGHAFYYKGVIFGIVIYDRFFLKKGRRNKLNYTTESSDPLIFPGKKRPVTLSYWSVPEHILEDDELLRRFVMDAYKASLEGGEKKDA
jgi:DNA transformation protein